MGAHNDPIDAAAWLRHLGEHIESARQGHEAEDAHQIRIAAARLDVWLRIGRRRMLRDDLRWLRRATGRVRNYDVLLATSLPAAFSEWLATERAFAREQWIAELGSPRCAALLGALAMLEPVEPEQVDAFVERARRTVKRRGRVLDADDATIEIAHRVRRAVRRLRFAHEWLGRKPRALKALQEVLGRVSDAAIALSELDRCPRAGELAELREQLTRDLQLAFDDALAAWRETELDVEDEADA